MMAAIYWRCISSMAKWVACAFPENILAGTAASWLAAKSLPSNLISWKVRLEQQQFLQQFFNNPVNQEQAA